MCVSNPDFYPCSRQKQSLLSGPILAQPVVASMSVLVYYSVPLEKTENGREGL